MEEPEKRNNHECTEKEVDQRDNLDLSSFLHPREKRDER